MIDFYILNPFNLMFGFALNKEIKTFELFIGLFAIVYSWGKVDDY